MRKVVLTGIGSAFVLFSGFSFIACGGGGGGT